MTQRVSPGPRERLLAAAQRLTYAHGVGIGIDVLLTEADVARRSLYQHFGGKDGLLAEVLRRTAAEDLARYRTVMRAAGPDPRRRLLAVFSHLDRTSGQSDFRGCRYLAADLALADATHPAHAVAAEYRRSVHQLLLDELRRLPHPHPARAADELHLLLEGVLAAAAARVITRPAKKARTLAARIIDQ